MHRIHLIGVSPGGRLDDGLRRILETCKNFYAAPRFHDQLEFLSTNVSPLSPLADALHGIKRALADGNVAVIVGGDPLFFGVGRRILLEFETESVQIHPAVTSMQMAFARLKRPWDDAKLLSLHGRSTPSGLAGMVLPYTKVCILAGGVNSPQSIAAQMIREGVMGYRAWVCEDLGDPEERITEGSLDDISRGAFSELSLMLLERLPSAPCPIVFGLSERELHHSRGLITKDEVRAVSLHALRLPAKGVLWDVGAGSGSVALEASRISPGVDIYAIERNPMEVKNIKRNIRDFGSSQIHVVEGEAPEVFAILPSPDRVFVGGSGGRLEDILRTGVERLSSEGIVVINAVLESTRKTGLAVLKDCGLELRTSEISVRRTVFSAEDGTSTDLNPITVIAGTK